MVNIADYKGKRVHFIGIGGCSMSGLAQIMLKRGYVVTGSDKAESPFTRRLKELGVPVTIGHNAAHVHGADIICYSAAIKPDNIERAEGVRLGIPELERSVLLGQLSQQYSKVVGIAGAHGKTTITSMLALICEDDALDATVHVGGFVDWMHGGVRLGKSDTFITEACEYVESFLTLRPTIALVNNIDDDHLDYFRDLDHITQAFEKFVALLPEDGLFIGCVDDARVKKLMAASTRRTLSYGWKDADYTPDEITYDELGCPSFTMLKNGKPLGKIKLHVQGPHNVINAIAAVAVGLELGVPFDKCAEALAQYTLTQRRFEYYGERGGVKYFHDYAHHPAEVRACMAAAEKFPHKELYVVFQCNSYTRAKTLFLKNVTCFELADHVMVPDIYPGREVDTGIVHARDMVKAINAHGEKAVYLPTFEQIREYIDAHASSGDIVVTLGSGDVYIQTRKLL
jgi:UDP-N-acetylmuramate--alanine ligase